MHSIHKTALHSGASSSIMVSWKISQRGLLWKSSCAKQLTPDICFRLLLVTWEEWFQPDQQGGGKKTQSECKDDGQQGDWDPKQGGCEKPCLGQEIRKSTRQLLFLDSNLCFISCKLLCVRIATKTSAGAVWWTFSSSVLVFYRPND